MKGQYLLYFIPLFIMFILAEYFVGRARGLSVYTKLHTNASIVIGLGDRILALIPFSIASLVWSMAYDHRITDLHINSWLYVACLFIGVEFFYYWMHRFSHEIRWLWATHSIHHSTQELNILSSSRLGWTVQISMPGLVYTPLFFIGFYPPHVLMMLAANLIFQSVLHTELVGKLGLLEGIFNTPSAHRVHHGKNVEYIDMNYGGILIVWDRLFGTYQEELKDIKIEYGLVGSHHSTNPLRIIFNEWIKIIGDLRVYPARYWILLLFGRPGWRPNNQEATIVELPDIAYTKPFSQNKTNDL